MEPERAHEVALALLGWPLPWRAIGGADRSASLATTVAGLDLANPLGLAAGFDKSCRRMAPLGRLGFGYVVGGTVTHRPRPGNARPRIARDPADRAIVNAMGMPNPGAEAVAARLARTPRTTSRWVSLADEERDDALAALAVVAPVADAIELNASSPNAGWTHRADHTAALTASFVERTDRPVFVKLPHVTDEVSRDGVVAMAVAAVQAGAHGLTCGNTVPVDDARMSTGRGGRSGGPLTAGTPPMIEAIRAATAGAVPVNACGGVFSLEDVHACLRAGAATVQVYTGLIYEGPGLVRTITRGLAGA
jgi:dihydroorotate dehydrogenase